MASAKNQRPSSLLKRLEHVRVNGVETLAARIVGRLLAKADTYQLARLQAAGNLEVGIGTYGTPKIFVSHPSDFVSIGNYCSIAPDVTLIPGGVHPTTSISTFPFRTRWGLESIDTSVSRRGPIRIGHDVWLGTGVTVLSGVEIGVGAIVAAGAVVTRDVAPYTVAAGVPARTIGTRLSQEAVETLLASKWWEYPEVVLFDNIDLLEGSDVVALTERLKDSSH